MILAFETSTRICSVAFQNKEGEVFEKSIEGRSVHSDHVFLFTQELMNEHSFSLSDLESVLVSNGPGSYTGLRIAVSAIKGLLFGSEVQLFAINTLAAFAMASNPQNGDVIHSIMDARRTHVYHQQFKMNPHLEAVTSAKIIEISELEKQLQPKNILTGSGISRLNTDKLHEIQCFGMEQISAKSLITLCESYKNDDFCINTKIEELNPNYISSSQVNNSNT